MSNINDSQLKELRGKLIRETNLRKETQAALKKGKQSHLLLEKKSRQMQEQLRYLSHHILQESEEQRRQISRELHDEIAQVLAGINVHLAALIVEAKLHTKGLSKKIVNTQHLVEKSVKSVHKFAQKLRPACLDDLGIIPALKNFINDYSSSTGTSISFITFAQVEELSSAKRTVLFGWLRPRFQTSTSMPMRLTSASRSRRFLRPYAWKSMTMASHLMSIMSCTLSRRIVWV